MAVATGTALLAGAIGSGVAGVAGAIGNRNAQKNSISDAERRRLESQQYIDQKVRETQGQLFNLFQPMQQNNNAAMLAGLDLYRQAFPQQLNSFNQGNMNAQQTMLAGLPQMNNAILGRPLDLSGIQARQTMLDPSMLGGVYNPQPINFAPIQQV